jgi:acetyl-CoA acyltransferase 1
MTHGYGPRAAPEAYSKDVLGVGEATDCLIPMGITSDNVAKEYNISRLDQDEFAAESFRRAAKAQKDGKFKREIVPVKTKIVVKGKDGSEEEKKVLD